MKSQRIEPILVLYATSGCHLCEQAEVLIRHRTTRIDTVEIVDDAELLDRYGIRIPVLRRVDNGEELDWPFDAAGIDRLLAG